MKVILCGYNWVGCKVLDMLKTKGYEVFVYTHKSPYHVPSVIKLCQKYNIPYSTENISKSKLPFKPDVVVSIYYRYIINIDVINSCNGKIFNLHPSLLPKYRGCSSVTWALINGEKEYGFTYHYVDNDCDTGNIILQRKLKIEEWDTQLSLYNKVMFASIDFFQEAFEKVIKGYNGVKQTGEATRYKRGCPYDGIIDDRKDIEFIERFIRAMYFPPYKGAMYKGKEINSIEEFLWFTKNEI